jgi:hypothetical protein
MRVHSSHWGVTVTSCHVRNAQGVKAGAGPGLATLKELKEAVCRIKSPSDRDNSQI